MAVSKTSAKKRTGSIQVFGNALWRLIQAAVRNSNSDGVVTAVNETKFTATVKVNEIEFHEVPLRVLISEQASFVEIPKVGTSCVIIFRDANMQRPYILEVHECTKILYKVGNSTCEITNDVWKFNGGSLGGMVKAEELKVQSEKDKAILDALIQILTGPPINEPGNGAPSALQIALAGVLAGKQPGTWDNLENSKITQ